MRRLRWLFGLSVFALVAMGLGLVMRDTEALETAGQSAARVTLDDVSESATLPILRAMDGERTVAELEQVAGVRPRDLRRLLKAAFGVLVFAPLAVASLERRLSGLEITRFPGSPYEIVRAYWQNMIAVRDHAPSLEQASP